MLDSSSQNVINPLNLSWLSCMQLRNTLLLQATILVAIFGLSSCLMYFRFNFTALSVCIQVLFFPLLAL